MGNNVYKILGISLMVAGGLFYTVERLAAKMSAAIVSAGYASNGVGSDYSPHYPGFFDNFFVWFFLFVGFLLLAYGFPKDNK